MSLFKNIILNDLKEEIDNKYDWMKDDIDLKKNIKENYITEEGINEINENIENNLNNSSMLNNNSSNSFPLALGNSFSGLKDTNVNGNNIETLYYDDIAEDTIIKKIENENNDNNDETKKKQGICCILFSFIYINI